jgi:hypothetical protein
MIFSFAAKANHEIKNIKISCTSTFFKQGLNQINIIEKNFSKTVEVQQKFFNKNIEIVKFDKKIKMDEEYSVRIRYNSKNDLSTSASEVEINGTLFRHRVGNGKIILGENSSKLDNRYYAAVSGVDVEIFNNRDLSKIQKIGFTGRSFVASYEQAVNYGLLAKGVVKSALIKCKTL